MSDSNLSIVCGPSCIYLVLPPSSAILVVIEMRIHYSIGGPIAEAAAVATNLRLVPCIYIRNYNIYHLYGCKRASW